MIQGVVRCRGGWFVIRCNIESDQLQQIDAHLFGHISPIIDTNAACTAINVPIGLLDKTGQRDCDKQVKRALQQRQSGFLRAPKRSWFLHTTAQSLKSAGGSIQDFSRLSYIKELDDCLTTDNRHLFREAYPELGYAIANNTPLKHGRKKGNGVQERHETCQQTPLFKECDINDILEAIEQEYPPQLVERVDMLDALILVWVAHRCYSNTAHVYGSPDQCDTRGFDMRVWS